jgi:hypothetical protein
MTQPGERPKDSPRDVPGRPEVDAKLRDLPPDQRPISRSQAAYLADIADVPAEKLVGRPIRELDELLRWKIDPELLFFRRVCGRVVRRDPGTGAIQGVPNATVHVEDTDCSFLGFFPVENPAWWWFWPISCKREVIATTTTDECGNFCVFLPRWDIDRIVRFRLQRICYPDIVRPNLRDLIEDLRLEPKRRFPIPPNPPDPPFDLPDADTLRQIGSLAGPGVAEKLAGLSLRTFGGSTDEMVELLDAPAFSEGVRPAVDDEALSRLERMRGEGDGGDEGPRVRNLPTKELVELVRRGPIVGPFLRCRDVFVAEWQLIFDVPDITFRVTQDVDLDGDEEDIYSESYFDVRWNAGSIPNVLLEASAIARPSPICDGPDIECVNQPAIRTVGLMTLDATHHDAATGYSIRVNRPHPGGLTGSPATSPAQAPYAGTLQLHGCHHIGDAQFYRLMYAYEGAGFVPFTGLEWWAPRIGPGGPIHVAPDANGWYPVLPEADLVFPHWLLNWPSGAYPHGKYDVKLQIGDGAKNVLDESATIAFVIDNRAPNAMFSQIRWRPTGGSWQDTFTWPFQCPVIRRDPMEDIEIEVSWWASAVHFRDATMGGGGCGGGNPTRLGPVSDYDHWHVNASDNAMSRVALFSLPGSLPEGSYTFSIDAHTRAFNPAGDGGGPAVDWLTDYAYSHAHPSVAVSVIDS